jgi:hypothetical protein
MNLNLVRRIPLTMSCIACLASLRIKVRQLHLYCEAT